MSNTIYIQYDSEKKYIQSIVKKSIRHRFIYIGYGLRAGTTTRATRAGTTSSVTEKGRCFGK